MDGGSGFALVPIFVIVFLACGTQAAAPVSPPESRFVWEPGANQSFTWTRASYDRFYYDPENGAGCESITINLANIKDRSIPIGGIVYHKAVGQTKTRYREFEKYAVIEFTGEKYLAEYPAVKSNITGPDEINQIRLRKILIDDNASHIFMNGSRVMLSSGHDIEIMGVNISDASVLLSLNMDGTEVNTRTLGVGENYIYETDDGQIIAFQVDSVIAGGVENSASIKQIFQTSESFTHDRKVNIFGVMKVTDVSDTGITMRNTAVPVDLESGRIIEIVDTIKIKVADSNDLRLYLYRDWGMENSEYWGALHTTSNNLTAWDGLNYAGFWYDIGSGNYSESLEITNMAGRRIPENGLTYTSYLVQVPYAVTNITGKKLPGKDGSYLFFNLGGNKYAVTGKGFIKILISHGDYIYEKKTLADGETWELGEGYSLTVKSIDARYNPRTALLVLKKNGIELENIWLTSGNVSISAMQGENGIPKLITYLDSVFAGATVDMIQLRYTWFVSDNVTQIKEGDMLGVFNVTVVEPDRIILKNRVPIDLKAGSSINLFGNLSFSVENSDELRFYPANVPGNQVMPEGNIVKGVWENPGTVHTAIFPATGQTERVAGFEWILAMTTLLTVYASGRKRR
ncbi:MAG: hypothetical protein FIB08_13760 [Candidatus Methanoperedens sp.]|nr:hypothetical protein [Candidatus Methanoperedens sp.]